MAGKSRDQGQEWAGAEVGCSPKCRNSPTGRAARGTTTGSMQWTCTTRTLALGATPLVSAVTSLRTLCPSLKNPRPSCTCHTACSTSRTGVVRRFTCTHRTGWSVWASKRPMSPATELETALEGPGRGLTNPFYICWFTQCAGRVRFLQFSAWPRLKEAGES